MRYIFILIILLLGHFKINAQTKSLREILVNSDIVAIVEPLKNDPTWDPKTIFVSDIKIEQYIDSIDVISYLKGEKVNFQKEKVIIKNSFENAFFESIETPSRIAREMDESYTEIIFCKKNKNTIELLFSTTIVSKKIRKIKEFIAFLDGVQEIKSSKKKSEIYIEKYLALLENKENEIREDFYFFENILDLKSNFMLYYRSLPEGITLTENQKERFRNYFFNISEPLEKKEMLKTLYGFYPKEVKNFVYQYFEKLGDIDYEKLNDEGYYYSGVIEFILEKENKLDDATKLQLAVLATFDNNIPRLKKMPLNCCWKK